MPKIDYDETQEYLETLVPPRESEIQKMEDYANENGFPIIGPVCGYYCYQLARMIGAKSIFELGSGYGYSTAWFAKAVKENGGGVVHHTVWDDDLSKQAADHLSKLGSDDVVEFHNAEAVVMLQKTDGPFDIIFNDIDKEGYPDSLPVIKEKLRSGGILIIDNMLWHGQTLDPNDHEKTTEAIRRFTRDITTDPDWIVSLTPIRDGMIVAYKQ
ncbi:MAG TPA: O-methyltransferase [Anaerolineales bacterium]|nr:O-methyltransferase [Anaerolineales bacterium]